MPQIRTYCRLAAALLATAVAACAAPPPPPVVARPPAAKPAPVADWFHRELALARHAKAEHRPPTDKIGADHAYYAIMIPACEHVAKLGPDKYRPRCKILLAKATAHPLPPIRDPVCDDHDDSQDSPADITTCSD